MIFSSFSLAGTWEMGYRAQPYLDTKAPPEAWCGFPVQEAVPGYWEDMLPVLRQAPFGNQLQINPAFCALQYPMAETAPDMTLPNVLGNFFYRRQFTAAAITASAALYFEGVQNGVSAWLNGVYLGRHEGYSTPFELKIPDGVLRPGDNTLLLSVSNHPLAGYGGEAVSGLTNRAVNACTGGITGPVELRIYSSRLRDAAVMISKDCQQAKVLVQLAEEGVAQLCWAVFDGEKLLKQGRQWVQNGTHAAAFTFDTAGLERWSPEHPKLYQLKLFVDSQEGSYTQAFGVRRLLPDGQQLKLNGRPYYLRGICEHCYFPETVHPNHDAGHYRRSIERIKALGFNFIRFHTHIPEEEYLQAADELGVLLHVESPNYTSLAQWQEIVGFCRRHPCVVIYCCGNELLMDDPFIAHLQECADFVHAHTDALFSPVSALRGLEYSWSEPEQEAEIKLQPFKHHPRRIRTVGQFADVFSSYPRGVHSYESLTVDPGQVDDWGSIYQKPRLSHEICIDGTYIDLRLKERYQGSRIGETALFSSVQQHLAEKGLLEKAALYFENSAQWQRRIRKYCFEAVRRSSCIAGFDFLGPIDTHWHTFGYDVGMMNEFYELKPGETVENVRMYNSPTVLLTDLGCKTNFEAGEALRLQLLVSHYGDADLKNGCLEIRLFVGGRVADHRCIPLPEVKNGQVSELYAYAHRLPPVEKPEAMQLSAVLRAEGVAVENCWELYLFPRAEEEEAPEENLIVTKGLPLEVLRQHLEAGKDVLLLGTEPFVSLPTSFRIALAGRSSGNLATVVKPHPALRELPCEGYCGWQFAQLLEGGRAIVFETDRVPFAPMIEVVSTHKYAIRQAALFEFRVEKGRLLVCSLDFKETDPAAGWLARALRQYVQSQVFQPSCWISGAQLSDLANCRTVQAAGNTNYALNANDPAAERQKPRA